MMTEADHRELGEALKSASRPAAGVAFERRLLADYDALGIRPAPARRRWSLQGFFAPAGALAGLCVAGYLAGAASVGAVAASGEERYAYLEEAFNTALPAAATEEDIW